MCVYNIVFALCKQFNCHKVTLLNAYAAKVHVRACDNAAPLLLSLCVVASQ